MFVASGFTARNQFNQTDRHRLRGQSSSGLSFLAFFWHGLCFFHSGGIIGTPKMTKFASGPGMKRSLSIYLWGCLLAILIVLAGLLLVRLGLITAKNSKRMTLLASVLAAAAGVWLVDDSKQALKSTFLDAATLFAVLGVAFFALFWVGALAGLRMFGHQHGSDFGESSILSMQYLDSIEDIPHDDQIWKTDPAEVSTPDAHPRISHGALQ